MSKTVKAPVRIGEDVVESVGKDAAIRQAIEIAFIGQGYLREAHQKGDKEAVGFLAGGASYRLKGEYKKTPLDDMKKAVKAFLEESIEKAE